MTDTDIIQALGGITAVSKLVGVKPPSVHGWTVRGIPDGQLVVLAARIERLAPDRFSRKARWPDTWAEIWPELAQPDAVGNAAAPAQQPAQEAAPAQAV